MNIKIANLQNLQMCVSGALLILGTGCSGSTELTDIPNRVPCSGIITVEGTPLEHGQVTFVPDNTQTGQQVAIGKVHNGHFKMFTTASAPGVVVGKYRVRVVADEVSKDTQNLAPGEIPELRSLIPVRYNDAMTSNLEVNVTPGMPSVKLDLKLE